MAALAGRIGDGINTRATHPRLAEILSIAREAHTRAGRDSTSFLVTVFSGLDERWLTVESDARRRLAVLGVDRLILFVGPCEARTRLPTAGRLANTLIVPHN